VTDDWQASARAMVADALDTLRTFEVFAAYRVAMTPTSNSRTTSMLAWDPPSGTAWDAATHVSRGLHDRANQLFVAIAAASVDSAQWRLQRELADAAHDLINRGDALRAYRDGVDRLPQGDALEALRLLDSAWAHWDAVAARFGISRGEPIACQR